MRAWPGLCTLLGLLGLALWLAPWPPAGTVHPLAWDAALWPQRPWTLWTASLVHLSPMHLLANLTALAALAVLGWFERAGPAQAAALLLAWPLSMLPLLAWPEVHHYAGLSGLLHAAALVLWARAAVQRDEFRLSSLLLPGIALKLLWEHAWSQPLAFDAGWGFTVVYAAHLGGAAVGAGCGLACAGVVWARPRRGIGLGD